MRSKASGLLAAALLVAACTGPSGSDAPGRNSRAPGSTIPWMAKPSNETVPARNWLEASCSLTLEYLRRLRRGIYGDRSPDVIVVPREPNFFGSFASTTHSGPWPYVQDVPIVFYGPGFIRGRGEIRLEREATLADIAPTLAALVQAPWPENRPGKAITEALVPARRRGVPRLVLFVVWDGGGWNVLNTWPRSWRHLRGLMSRGTSVVGATVGSSPSVTPAVHTTMGTGAWPDSHGIVDIPIRQGDTTVSSFMGFSPRFVELPTLADIHDRATGNAAKVGLIAYKSWHVGMMGHGAHLPGGDRDIAAIVGKKDAKLLTNPGYYSLPPYLADVPGFEEDVRTVDASDGRVDGRWMGHDVLGDSTSLRHTPVWSLYQTRLLKALVAREGFGADDVPDLLFTNYKQVDQVGHDWNMLNPEMREVLRFTDDALESLTRWLDSEIGRDRWVLVYTADHGQAPDARAAGAWPVGSNRVAQDIAGFFGVAVEDLVIDQRPSGFWLDRRTLARRNITPHEIADFLIRYRLRDNVPTGSRLPEQYRARARELLFAAAWPSASTRRVMDCARGRTGGS